MKYSIKVNEVKLYFSGNYFVYYTVLALANLCV